MTTIKMHHIVDDLAISEGTYSLVSRIEDTANTVLNTVRRWKTRSHDRRQLAALSDRLLEDIGLDRAEVTVEVNKFFWQD